MRPVTSDASVASGHMNFPEQESTSSFQSLWHHSVSDFADPGIPGLSKIQLLHAVVIPDEKPQLSPRLLLVPIIYPRVSIVLVWRRTQVRGGGEELQFHLDHIWLEKHGDLAGCWGARAEASFIQGKLFIRLGAHSMELAELEAS